MGPMQMAAARRLFYCAEGSMTTPKGGPPLGAKNTLGNSGGEQGKSGPPADLNAKTHGCISYLRTGRLPREVDHIPWPCAAGE